MCLQDNVNWEMAKTKFQDFLHHKLNIDRSSVIIQGIVSTSDTWYIMEGTPALLRALNNHIQQAHNNRPNEPEINPVLLVIGGVAAVIIVVLMGLVRR